MWQALLQLAGIGLPAILDEIKDWRLKELNAKNAKEKIDAETHIKELQTRADVIKRNQDNFLARLTQFLWSFPFIIYVWKLVLWDKVLELGTTDPLSPTLLYILWTVLGGSFLYVYKGKK